MIRRAPLVALGLAAAGCHHIVYTTGLPPSGAPIVRSHDQIIFGLVEKEPVDLARPCPNGFATVDNVYTFSDGFIAFYTGNLWSPNTVTITCAAEGSSPPPQPPVPYAPLAPQNPPGSGSLPPPPASYPPPPPPK